MRCRVGPLTAERMDCCYVASTSYGTGSCRRVVLDCVDLVKVEGGLEEEEVENVDPQCETRTCQIVFVRPLDVQLSIVSNKVKGHIHLVTM